MLDSALKMLVGQKRDKVESENASGMLPNTPRSVLWHFTERRIHPSQHCITGEQ